MRVVEPVAVTGSGSRPTVGAAGRSGPAAETAGEIHEDASGARVLGEADRRRRRIAVLAIVVGADVAAIALATALAFIVRTHLGFVTALPLGSAGDLDTTAGMAAPYLVSSWALAIACCGGYADRYFGQGMDEYQRVLRGTLLAGAIAGTVCYVFGFELARGFFLVLFVTGAPLLVLGRFLVRRAIHRLRRNGRLARRSLIVGAPRHIDEITQRLGREAWLGYSVVGCLTPSPSHHVLTDAGVPVLGTRADLQAAIRDSGASVVLFAQDSTSSSADFRSLLWTLEGYDVEIVVVPNLADVAASRVRMRPVAGLPLMHLEKPRAVKANRWQKRLWDVVGSALLLILASPLLAVCAAIIRIEDGGPVFFRQTRVGRDGKEFSFIKLRSMVTDAEVIRGRELEGHGHGNGVMFKMKRDPRVTRVGTVLRRFSLDELPQLLNVLRGDMSLIGPRPPLRSEVEGYDATAMRRLSIRPGLTGLWQVSGRSDLSWEETVRLDLYYVDNWSILQDVTILVRTVRAVVAATGAY